MKRYIALGILFLATACGSWQGTGTVVKKGHDDAYVTSRCTTVNKTTNCVPVTHPERWKLQVKDAEGKKHWVTVPEITWASHHIGDEYTT